LTLVSCEITKPWNWNGAESNGTHHLPTSSPENNAIIEISSSLIQNLNIFAEQTGLSVMVVSLKLYEDEKEIRSSADVCFSRETLHEQKT